MGSATETLAQVMTFGAVKPKAPNPPPEVNVPAPTPPTIDEADTQARLQAAAAREKQKRQRATSTILTTPQGVLEEAPVAMKTLLGA